LNDTLNFTIQKKVLLDYITSELKVIKGVEAIVLGGSHAIGMANNQSDLDIGIYYSQTTPFEINLIKEVANQLSDKETAIVTGFYEWGPWVNGGAWISNNEVEIDFIYKNIEQIKSTINNAKKGIWENHYEQQPPFGFSSITYLAETQYCIALYDPKQIIQQLKEDVRVYPQELKKSVVQQSLWSAEFTIWQAQKFATKLDVYNTIGCLTRAIKSIVTALFAINEIYPLGDKRAFEILEKNRFKPIDFADRVQCILTCTNKLLLNNVHDLKTIFVETTLLAENLYTPYYDL